MAQSKIQRFSTIESDPLRNFRFLVNFEVTGRSAAGGDQTGTYMAFSGGFTSVSGLNITTANIGYREGGMNTTLHQIPGQTTFAPITLSRGVLRGKDEAINWMKTLFAAAAGEGISGAQGKNFRCNLEVIVLDHPLTGAPALDGDVFTAASYKMKFKVHNAWIQQLSFSDLSASDNNIMYETMTLVHEGLSVSFP